MHDEGRKNPEITGYLLLSNTESGRFNAAIAGQVALPFAEPGPPCARGNGGGSTQTSRTWVGQVVDPKIGVREARWGASCPPFSAMRAAAGVGDRREPSHRPNLAGHVEGAGDVTSRTPRSRGYAGCGQRLPWRPAVKLARAS